ncbi:hypothetical protein CMI47_03755 [Candidatus Pacearchaeota archaeon]|jgi:hypothetical protein|nr:hypothetical protein [Candidatus Pacearchaeota archaeon]|tara:strand:+ start:329 stop:667 length:339 start_codon:yes stop_codon:yes gene_type:complete
MTLPARIKKPRKKDDRKWPAHLRFVRTRHCIVPGCKETPVQACHVRIGTDGSLSRKPHDGFTVSMCETHHEEQHHGERSFAERYGLDMYDLALEFARKSPVPEVRKWVTGAF